MNQSRAVFTVLSLTFTAFAMSACGEKGSSSEAAHSAATDIVVAQSDNSSCHLNAASYKCDIATISDSGQNQYQMKIAVSKNSQGRTSAISIEGYKYMADGQIHRARNTHGVEFEYSVSCQNELAQINVKSTNSPSSLRVDVSSTGRKKTSATYYAVTKEGAEFGTGSCRSN